MGFVGLARKLPDAARGSTTICFCKKKALGGTKTNGADCDMNKLDMAPDHGFSM